MGIIQKSGTSYGYGDTKLGRGYDATRQFLREDKKLSEEILKQIRAKLKDNGGSAVPVSASESEASADE